MKKFISLMAAFFLLASMTAQAAELVRQKNVATYIFFPIVKNDGTLITGAAGLDSEIDAFSDGAAPNGFTDCTNEATEIGSTGQYYLSLTQAEMNADYISVQVKSSTTGALTQTLLLRTMVGDPLNFATTDDGGTINVTSGKIDEVATLTGNTAQTGDSYAIVVNKLNVSGTLAHTDNASLFKADVSGLATAAALAVAQADLDNPNQYKATGFSTHSAADVWAVGARTVTGGTITALGTDTITAASIAANAIGASEIADNAIDAGAIAAAAITSSEAPNLDAAISTRSTYAGGAVASVTGNVGGNVVGSCASVTAPVTVGTNSDKTGYSLAADQSAVTIGTVTTLTNWDKTGYALSAAGVDAIWDESQSGHSTAGTFGKYLDAQVSAAGGTSLTTAEIADAVWDELIAGHLTEGSAGNKLNAAGNAGDPWGVALPGSYEAGTAGAMLSTVKDSTDGDKENDEYTGIEKTIRTQR
jgi:hypothetical protein